MVHCNGQVGLCRKFCVGSIMTGYGGGIISYHEVAQRILEGVSFLIGSYSKTCQTRCRHLSQIMPINVTACTFTNNNGPAGVSDIFYTAVTPTETEALLLQDNHFDRTGGVVVGLPRSCADEYCYRWPHNHLSARQRATGGPL